METAESFSHQALNQVAIPKRRKLLYAAITTAGFFLFLELSLTLLGVRPVTDVEDPYVGFSSVLPVYEPVEAKPGLRTTAANKIPWFNPQTFPAQKPPGTYRIVCLGGSTTFGRPFRDPTSFCGWLRAYLQSAEPDRKWEVINAGGVSYASYRVATVMEEMTQYEPDLFIVYTGQNEFLEWRTYDDLLTGSTFGRDWLTRLSQTRTFALMSRITDELQPSEPPVDRFELPAEVDEILNHTVGPTSYRRDPQWRRQVLDHFQQNLERMALIAKQSGARMLLVTPTSNLKDCSPFRSDPTDGVPSADLAAAKTLRAAAEQRAAEQDLETAIGLINQAIELDPANAELHFQLGQVQFRAGRNEAARTSFLAAIDEDVCPLRAVSEILAAVRRTAASQQIMLVDYERRLTAHCESQWGHTCLGAELFLDHVHPTVDAHRLLGEWLFEELKSNGIVSGTMTDDVRAAAAAVVESSVDPADQGVALRNLAKVLHWAGKFEEAGPLAEKALTMLPDDFPSTAVAADCLRETGRVQESVAYYQRSIELNPLFHHGYLRLGQIASSRGDYLEASELLEAGLLLEPDVAYGQFEKGYVQLQLGEMDAAAKSLNRAIELSPDYTAAMFFLGRVRQRQDQPKEAARWYREIVRLDPEDAEAHHELGGVLLQLNQREEAIRALQRAVAIRPNFEEALIRLEDALQ